MQLRARKLPSALLGAFSFVLVLATASQSDAKQTSMTPVYEFCKAASCTDGAHPVGTMLMDTSQNLYGTTEAGGQFGGGTVYKIIHNAVTGSYRYLIVHNFCNNAGCTDGGKPIAGSLIIDTDGSLYGTASMGGPTGGSSGAGVVYKLTPGPHNTYAYSLIYNFCQAPGGCQDGMTPVGNITYAGASNGTPYDKLSPLYGETSGGGRHNAGVVFSLTLTSDGTTYKELPIYHFCSVGQGTCLDGQFPTGGIGMDPSGNIAGATISGGASNAGIVFRLTPSDKLLWTQALMHDFCSSPACADGMTPSNGVLVDHAGNMFGTTTAGGNTNSVCGNNGCGVAFKINPNAVLTQLHAFCSDTDCADGGVPSTLSLDHFDVPVGLTSVGGAKKRGTLYQMNSGYQVLFNFKCKPKNCSEGKAPDGGIVADPSDNLFGTTSDGGRNGSGGAIFRYTPAPG